MLSTRLLSFIVGTIVATSTPDSTLAATLTKKGACKDSSPNCEKWALDGMCRQDPDMKEFMDRRCPFACDACEGASGKRDVINARDACVDVDLGCEEMAIDGLCFDPAHQTFMEKSCPFACDVCSDRKRRRARAIADLTVAAAASKRSMKEEEEEKRGCEDVSPKCELYAIDGLCSDAETSTLMAKMCPFACDVCKRQVEARDACVDTDPACEEMATDGLCFDPAYQTFMEKACPYACDVCSGRKKRRARAIAELHVDAAIVDAAMESADAEKRSDEDKRACEDFSAKCEAYATDGLCSDSETTVLMAKTCPFACDICKREMKITIRRARSLASLVADAASAASAIAADAGPEMEKKGCYDFSPKCEQYATDGLCLNFETSVLMAKTCPNACDGCKKRQIEIERRDSCKDKSAKCEVWAGSGMCRSDPDMEHFMAKTCPYACDVC